MNKALFSIKQRKRSGHFSMPKQHFHEDYEIYYLLSGERHIFIKDRTYTIRKGEMAFIGKDELHKTTDTGTADHERIAILFKGPFLNKIAEPHHHESLLSPFHRSARSVQFHTYEQNFIEALLFGMLHESREGRSCSELYMHALMTQLLIYIHRLTDVRNTYYEPVNQIHQKISVISAYINEHYREPLSLSTVAETFYFSTSYLSRTFKKVTGFTFIEYINSIRMKEAQRLLRETKLKVTDIAELVGFDNIVHFGRVFKQATALTALEYRKAERAPLQPTYPFNAPT